MFPIFKGCVFEPLFWDQEQKYQKQQMQQQMKKQNLNLMNNVKQQQQQQKQNQKQHRTASLPLSPISHPPIIQRLAMANDRRTVLSTRDN